MPKMLTFAWVKNVYSLRTDSGMNGGYTPLSYTALTKAQTLTRVQVPSFTQVYSMLSTVLSTLKSHIQPLLIADLYPVSTAPTIKKKKENKERNS
jgi:hypothetical protein